jgi:hypothetical protein
MSRAGSPPALQEKRTMSDEKDASQKPFNAREHVIQLKSREGSKDYLPVQYRLVWFREQCPNGSIETEIVHLDLDKETFEETFAWNSEKRRSEKVMKSALGVAIVRAVVRDGKGGVATGTKMEKAAAFPDWLEKAETGAIGRALAALGYGTQFAPEMDEAHRLVDAPVERPSSDEQSASSSEASITPLPTFKQMFAAGKEKGLWSNSAGFYQFSSDLLKITVDGGVSLSHDQRAQLAGAIESAQPVQKAS